MRFLLFHVKIYTYIGLGTVSDIQNLKNLKYLNLESEKLNYKAQQTMFQQISLFKVRKIFTDCFCMGPPNNLTFCNLKRDRTILSDTRDCHFFKEFFCYVWMENSNCIILIVVLQLSESIMFYFGFCLLEININCWIFIK